MSKPKQLAEINKYRKELKLHPWIKLWSMDDQQKWAGPIHADISEEAQKNMSSLPAFSLGIPDYETIKIRKIDKDSTAETPSRKHKGDAGIDLYASHEVLVPASGLPARVHTGHSIEVPESAVGLIQGRSSLAAKCGIVVLGGVVDHGYSGEVIVMLRAISGKSHKIEKGKAIAQMIIFPCCLRPIEYDNQVMSSSEKDRGCKGFGSTDQDAIIDIDDDVGGGLFSDSECLAYTPKWVRRMCINLR